MSLRSTYDRQDHESQEAYKAFCEYRSLHPLERSIQAVERRLGRQCGHWASQWDWVERVVQWDEETDRARRAIKLQEYQKRELEQIEGLGMLQDLTIGNIEKWVEVQLGADDKESPPIMTLQEIRLSMDSLIKLYRLINSESTEIVESKDSSKKDLTRLSLDELMKLKEINKKLKD